MTSQEPSEFSENDRNPEENQPVPSNGREPIDPRPSKKRSLLDRCLLFVIVLLLASSCYTGWVEFGQFPYLRWSESRAAIGKTGFVGRTFHHDVDVSHPYLLFVPKVPPPEDGYPVILFLNGLGDNGEDGYRQIANTFGRPVWEMQEAFPFLVVMPQCPTNSAWMGDAQTLAFGSLDKTLAEYPTDSKNIILSGASLGGTAALQIAEQNPERFSAVVPVATGGGNSKSFSKAMAEHQISVWSFYHGKDASSVVEFNRQLGKELKISGAKHFTTEYPRNGHDGWNYGYRTPGLYRWLLTGKKESPDEADWWSGINKTEDSTPIYSVPNDQQLASLLGRAEKSDGKSIRWRMIPPNDNPMTWTFGAGLPDSLECSAQVNEDSISIISHRRVDADSDEEDIDRNFDFNFALAMRMSDPQAVAGPWQQFERTMTVDRWTDRYSDSENETVWPSPFTDPATWARMVPDLSPRNRLDSANTIAALFAVGAIDQLHVDTKNMKALPTPEIIREHSCTILEETIAPQYIRRLWVDAEGRILRVHGSVPPPDDTAVFEENSAMPLLAGDTFIDIEYDTTGEPSGWTVAVGEGANCPVRWVVRSVVLK